MKKNELIKMSDEDYFALEALSNSGVKRLLKTPAHFLEPIETTPAMNIGSLVHCMIMEPDMVEKRFVCAPDCDRRTKTGKEIYKEFVESSKGKIVVSVNDWLDCEQMAISILKYKFYGINFKQVVEDCQKEMAIIWDQNFAELGFDEFTVKCKSKYDLISDKHKIIFDVKTCQDASPDGFRRAMYNETMGYYLQSAFYRLPEAVKDYKFCFICVEKKPPFAVAMYYADDEVLEEAYNKIHEAAEIYKHGIETNEFSNQYNDKPEELKPFNWFYYKQK